MHDLGPRAAQPFIAVNCGALVDSLLESELFGHERGAFTDAHARRQGLISQAAGGTLFLDEAEMLTPRAQVALLRVVHERAFRPVGSACEQRTDARFVAATNARVDRLVQAGSFRADLYYRLCVFSVTLPPLRDRCEDILPLAAHFLAKHTRTAGPPPRLSHAAAEALLGFEWPGNVRELESAIVRAVHVATSDTIGVADLGLLGGHGDGAPPTLLEAPGSYKAQKRCILDAFDRQYLTRLMTQWRGNVSSAARAAGKERRDLGKLFEAPRSRFPAVRRVGGRATLSGTRGPVRVPPAPIPRVEGTRGGRAPPGPSLRVGLHPIPHARPRAGTLKRPQDSRTSHLASSLRRIGRGCVEQRPARAHRHELRSGHRYRPSPFSRPRHSGHNAGLLRFAQDQRPSVECRGLRRHGIQTGIVWGTLIAGVEFLGGLALCLSVYPELVAALFGFQMLVGSFWKYKRGKPFDEYFYDVQLFGLCVVIMHFGGGGETTCSDRFGSSPSCVGM